MTYTFRAGPDRTVQADLEQAVAQLLVQLFGEMIELLGPTESSAKPTTADPLAVELGLDDLGAEQPSVLPQDPALARLFPNAYPEDEQASAEFRRYTESDLRSGKRDRIRRALETLGTGQGGKFDMDEEQAQCWLGALNDLRLVLGARFGLSDDGQEPGGDLAPEDPMQVLVPAYYYLGYLQESLIEALPR
ncbi:DUF2017 domain-containing protein [Actinospica durhamensis]|uniref:DUF2017 domain-containing protein n=1 Tax=Actinospica durhamensis TaxID=1508375 RepID=A0A941IS46_9ACTN|nr:DUF2017 domain-containing protein [Actinospica durhamensis]MBR7839535.1 DUF2017 domain-containing protein [Actinospica durhamensis]